MKNHWDARIRRASELASIYPFAAEGLKFYSGVAAQQRDLYSEFQQELAKLSTDDVTRLLRDDLDSTALQPRFHNFLTEIAKIAPRPLAQAAAELAHDTTAAQRTLEQFWNHDSRQPIEPATTEAPDASPVTQSLAWLFLQPYAECLTTVRGPVFIDGTPSTCPVCGAKPVVGVLRPEGDGAKKSLVCMLCSHEWRFRRVYCPSCGEEREPQMAVYSSPEIPYVRVDVCDTCHTYLKTVDLTKNGLLLPLVDEMAALPLDLWAREHGYEKLQINMLGI